MADAFVPDENIIMNGQMAGEGHDTCNVVIKEIRSRFLKSASDYATASGELLKKSKLAQELESMKLSREAATKQIELLYAQVNELNEKLRKTDILEATCAGFRRVLTDYVKQQTENKCIDPTCGICTKNRKDSVEAAMKALEVPVGHQMLNVFRAAELFIDNVSMNHNNNDGDESCHACGGLYRDGKLKHRVACEFKQLRDAVCGTDTVGQKDDEEVPF